MIWPAGGSTVILPSPDAGSGEFFWRMRLPCVGPACGGWRRRAEAALPAVRGRNSRAWRRGSGHGPVVRGPFRRFAAEQIRQRHEQRKQTGPAGAAGRRPPKTHAILFGFGVAGPRLALPMRRQIRAPPLGRTPPARQPRLVKFALDLRQVGGAPPGNGPPIHAPGSPAPGRRAAKPSTG